MTASYRGEVFRGVDDFSSGATFQNMYFEKCEFTNCSISATRDPNKRSTFRSIELIECSATACHIGAGFFEECTIRGLSTGRDLFQTFASAFRHVAFMGKFDRLMFSAVAIDVHQWPELRRQFEEQNDEFYKKTDWALDISKAEFLECDIRGIAAHLIRRDPETQIVITRESAMRGEWRNLDLKDTYWATAIQVFLDEGYPSLVLVAPKRDKDIKKLLRGIQLLRRAGISEPD